jgi:acyl-CoA thioesterase-1
MLRLCRVALVGLGAACALAGAAPAPDPCGPPDDLAGAVGGLPKVADAIKTVSRLRVLAVGSATMFGPEASLQPGTVTSQSMGAAPTAPALKPPATPVPSEGAFPMQMAKALRAALPGVQVDLVLRGGRGMTAADMLGQLRQELQAGQYQLVLWQTGTVEAVRNTPPGEFAQTLSEGAEAVEAAKANLILIDPQFSRFLQMNSNLDPYIQALQQAASMPGVLMFHRFDLMRSWANDGRMDLERTPKPDRKRTVEALHACLGAHLANLIMAGARS